MKRLITLMLLILMTNTGAANTNLPINANEIYEEFISTFNTKDLKRIEQYVDSRYAETTLKQWDGSGRERYIGYSIDMALFHSRLKLIKLSSQEHNNNLYRLRAEVYSINTDMHYHLNISIEDKAPYLLRSWYLSPNYNQEKGQKKISEKELTEKLKAYVDKLAGNRVFSGTLLLAKNNNVLLSAAHGLASRRYDVKNNLDTKFQIGSMNKMFTAVATLQLIESGELSLENKLTQFLDAKYFGEGSFDKITIRQLLTHTSGLGGNPEFGDIQSKVRTLDDALDTYKSIKLDFEPGTQRRYSNTGMRMLGHVIESVSGKSYYDYINDNVYKKANMISSGSFDLDVPVKNTARNYWFYPKTNSITENLMLQGVKGDPAGGGYSTVTDLFNFAQALTKYELLNKSLTEEAISAKPELHSPYYGYGFSVRGEPDNRIIGHNGSHLGMSAQLSIYLDKGYVLSVLGNSPNASVPVIAKFNQLLAQVE